MGSPAESSDDKDLAKLAQQHAKTGAPAQEEAAAANAPADEDGAATAAEAQPSRAGDQQVKSVEPEERPAAKGAGKQGKGKKAQPVQRRGSKRDRRAPEHFDPNEDYKHGKGVTRQGSATHEDGEGQTAGPPAKKARLAGKGAGSQKGRVAAAEDQGDDDEPPTDKAPTFDEDEDVAGEGAAEAAGGSAEPEVQIGGRGRGGRGGRGGKRGGVVKP